jgi:hypothetical protein
MIEVFKTNIHRRETAEFIVSVINALRPEYCANFDLDDCDHILRVKADGTINTDQIIELVRTAGFNASVLDDEILSLPLPFPGGSPTLKSHF